MKVYNFDFANSLGDTIMEKYESFFLVFHGANKENRIRFVVGSPETVSMFVTARSFNTFEPVQMGELRLVGRVDHGPQMSFEVFQSDIMVKNELVLFGNTANAMIKFENFLI